MLKFIIASLSLVFIIGSAQAESFRLKYGTLVPLTLQTTVTSEANNEGDMVTLVVERNITAEDGKTILIKRGAPVKAFITRLEERGRMGEGGAITITTKMATAVDGTAVPVFGTISRKGKDKEILWSYYTKGKKASVPAGTSIDAYVDAETLVNVEPVVSVTVENETTAENAKTQESVPEYLQKYTPLK